MISKYYNYHFLKFCNHNLNLVCNKLTKKFLIFLTDYYNHKIPGNFTKYSDYFTNEQVWNDKTTVIVYATYGRSGTTVTITSTSHSLVTGNYVNLNFTNTGATSGIYVITKIDANSFTIVDPSSGAISSNTTTELLTNPLILEEKEVLKVQAANASRLQVLASVLEIEPRTVVGATGAS